MRLKEYFSSNPTTLTLIFTNIIIFIALNTFSYLSGLFLLDPSINMVMNRPWTLLTVIFSHELHIHILLNMFLVLIFGTQLERETNAKVVLYVYLLSGFIGSLTIPVYASQIGFDGELLSGASAAAFGIVAAYAALQPNNIILKSKSKYWVVALFIVNAVLTIQNPYVSVGGPAHAVGIVVGLIFGYLFKRRFKGVKNDKQ